MNWGQIVDTAIMGIMAALSFVVAFRQHRRKGFIFTNKWLYATKKERAEMDERIRISEYRFSRNVFILLGVDLLIFAISFLIMLSCLFYIGFALMAIVCIYAIVQWIFNERYYKNF